MFTTVRGHVFEWTLLKDEEAKHQTLEPDAILNFVEFSDSVYATDPIIGKLEEQVIVWNGCSSEGSQIILFTGTEFSWVGRNVLYDGPKCSFKLKCVIHSSIHVHTVRLIVLPNKWDVCYNVPPVVNAVDRTTQLMSIFCIDEPINSCCAQSSMTAPRPENSYLLLLSTEALLTSPLNA